MMQCPIPSDEDARLAALYNYSILDTAPEHAFDRLTRLARMALGMPIVLVSLLDQNRQWFKSTQGLDISETARSISFCDHAIRQSKPYIVSDARLDPLFRDNPLVVGEPFIRFYIGIPLKTRNGHVVGTLCAMDRRPRALWTEEIDVLQDLASMVVDAIELRLLATTDSLTGALTRRGLETEISRDKQSGRSSTLVAVDIDHFKSVNDRYGHAVGDLVLKSLVATIKRELDSAGTVARMGGEEFMILLPETDCHGARIVAERIRQRIAETPIGVNGEIIRVTASLGIATGDASDATWRTALEKADVALYSAKRNGRDRTVCYDDLLDTIAA